MYPRLIYQFKSQNHSFTTKLATSFTSTTNHLYHYKIF